MPFHPFCSQGQNEQNVANENPRWRTARWALRIQIRLYRRKNSGYTFGQNETLFLISLYQNTGKITAITALMAASSSAAIFVTQCLLGQDRRGFFMQTIRIIPSIPYQPFLFQNCGYKNAPLVINKNGINLRREN